MNQLFANSLYTIHQGKTGGRGLSPRLWAQLMGQSLSPDGLSNAFSTGDDFLNFGAIAPGAGGTTSGTAHQGYGYFVDTTTAACSIKQIATEVGGVCQLALSNQDNYDAILTAGGNSGVMGVISNTAGANKFLAFESRVRFGQVSDATYNAFVGLTEEGCAATDSVFTDAGALADKDLIGFAVLEADGDALKFVYKKAGQTAQTVLTYGTALSAATWYKLGFVYDPNEAPAKRIKIYVNNVEQSTYVTSTNIAAATFPNGEELTFTAGLKNASTATKTFDLDWWNFFQFGS